MSDTTHVSIIIVHYGAMDDTIECIISLSQIEYLHYDVFVVNNGAPNFDADAVKAIIETVHIIESSDNLGFTGGNNLGIQEALTFNTDYIFLLNNDTVVKPDILQKLLRAFSSPEIGVVGPIINYYDKVNDTWFAGGKYNQAIGYSMREYPLRPHLVAKEVDWINGCALMIKRTVIEQIGLLWEPYFLNFEDLDWCLRARAVGYQCVLVGQVLVFHKVSSSNGIRGSDQLTPNKSYYMARNSLLSLKRHGKGIWLLTGFISQFVIIMPFWFLQSIRHGNFRVMIHYIAGLIDGILGKVGKRST